MTTRPNPLRLDPTRTAGIRRALQRELGKRFRDLRAKVLQLVRDGDAFGLHPAPRLAANAGYAFLSSADKIEAFKRWLARQAFADTAGRSAEELMRRYIEEGFKKGQGRVFQDFVSRADPAYLGKTEDFYQGTKQQFLESSFNHPVAQAKVNLLTSRIYTELEGVNQQMARGMTRVLADGLVQGQSPREVGRALTAEVDIGRVRADRIARTETIRAHAEGQLQALGDLGVEELGVMVEWSTSGLGFTKLGNPSPCPKCAALKGVVLKLSEAQGLLPLHPNCMCSYVPANVGEARKGQKRTKGRIDAALEDAGVEDKAISRTRPKAIVVAFNAEKSQYGPGQNPNSHRKRGVNPGDLIPSEVGPSEARESEADTGVKHPALEATRKIIPKGSAYPAAVVTEKDGELHLLDGHHRAIIAEERGDKLPVVTVKQHHFNELSKQGFSHPEISYAALKVSNPKDPQLAFLEKKHGSAFKAKGELAAKELYKMGAK